MMKGRAKPKKTITEVSPIRQTKLKTIQYAHVGNHRIKLLSLGSFGGSWGLYDRPCVDASTLGIEFDSSGTDRY
jgi:hypothetical protein